MQKVILYVNSSCWHCDIARRCLINYGIDFEERDINNAVILSELKLKGVRTVPVVIIDDYVLTFQNWERIRDRFL